MPPRTPAQVKNGTFLAASLVLNGDKKRGAEMATLPVQIEKSKPKKMMSTNVPRAGLNYGDRLTCQSFTGSWKGGKVMCLKIDCCHRMAVKAPRFGNRRQKASALN
jgi:hypothetical protein